MHGHDFRGFEFHRGIDQHPLHRLEVADRVAELLPLVRIRVSALESRFRDPDGERGDPDAATIEHSKSLFSPAPKFAEQLALRVFEAQFRGVARAHSVGVNFAHGRDLVFHHDERADLVLAFLRLAGCGHHYDEIRCPAAGDEFF